MALPVNAYAGFLVEVLCLIAIDRVTVSHRVNQWAELLQDGFKSLTPAESTEVDFSFRTGRLRPVKAIPGGDAGCPGLIAFALCNW